VLLDVALGSLNGALIRFEPNGTSQYYSIFRNSRAFPVLQKNAEVIQSVVIVLSSVRWVKFTAGWVVVQ
jgi:hypothetical protein